MDDFNFDLIHYRRPYQNVGKRSLGNLIGIDSEAYPDGKSFMFPTSIGTIIRPDKWPHILGSRAFKGANFVTWNLRYDSGAFLQHLPDKAVECLRVCNEVTWEGWKYVYYPHKFLRISKGQSRATFWDILPFYKSSLDAAAKKHLGESKHCLDPKKFTRRYVNKNWAKISAYGIQDAKLTLKLAVHMIGAFESFGMRVSGLYSTAFVSAQYFKKQVGIQDVWRQWRSRQVCLRYACDAYWGGKFEITQRGKFEGYNYDISSAYPHEISKLLDIQRMKITRGSSRPDSAVYGFVKIRMYPKGDISHSIPMRVGGVNIFPSGEYDATVTLAELDDLHAAKIPFRIIDGYWFKSYTTFRPYKKIIDQLYAIKEGAGKENPWIRAMAKLLMTSFYGKLIQLTRVIPAETLERMQRAILRDGIYTGKTNEYIKAGNTWNPIFGAIITANVRIRVSKIQRDMGTDCLGVHTDSAITTKRFPKSWLGTGLGSWQLERKGPGLIVGCGIYDLGDKIAFRGFKVRDGITWEKRLKAHKGNRQLEIPITQVASLLGAVKRKRRVDANVFIDDVKKVNLNADRKRLWIAKSTPRTLLKGLQDSCPQIIIRG